MNIPVVYHPNYFSDIGNHVFQTEKFQLIYEGLKERVEDFEAKVYQPGPADREQVQRVHTPVYLDDLNSYEHLLRYGFNLGLIE